MFSVNCDNNPHYLISHGKSIDSNQGDDLRQKWAVWSERATGLGQCRESALIRLLDCQKRNALSLDLGGLGLTELPDLPAGIEELNAGNNALTALFVIPSGLKRLDVSHNLLEYLPSVPSTVEELNLANNKFEKTPLIEHYLKKLDISNNPIDLGFPKIIHYIWLGKSTLPDYAISGIINSASLNPDYEVRVWVDHPVKTIRELINLGYSTAIISKNEFFKA